MPRTPLCAFMALLCLTALPAGAQPQPGAEAELESNRYMEYANPKSWLVEGLYFIYPDGRRVRNYTDFQGWRYEDLRIVMPYVAESAHAWAVQREPAFPLGSVAVERREHKAAMEATPARVPGTHAPYMIYDATSPLEVNQLQFTFVNALTCVETRFDEKAAWDLPWPDQWPETAAPWLERDPVFDVDDPQHGDAVTALLEEWTGGADPKSVPPVQLAKFLTGSVLGHVRANANASEPLAGRPPRIIRAGSSVVQTQAIIDATNGLTGLNSLAGMIGGFHVQNASATAASATGSFHDYSVLLTAVLRRAGIPARTVVGIDKRESGAHKKYKSWVEFALVAPDLDRVLWVPVDVWELRGSGRNARNWQQPWKHFGTSDRLRDTVPVAYHFHPPADYASYDFPALYGIRAPGALPDLGVQGLVFNVNSLPNRGGQ